ncbi:YciI family protein [Actinoplanes sp. CA-142083]|uniref:YciI family protein n=1 Tax=Actinoplanes sp. CA-142083 TaxID=3239903 RepID=UPI003D90858B
MEYFFYCRDRDGVGDLRWRLVEEHWSFMDDYADGMIARGPTFVPGRDAPTGSVHIVDLPDAEAARVFAFEEPNYRAGVYGEVLVRRFVNMAGRTMWEFPERSGTDERFLILAHAEPGVARNDAIKEADEDRLIVWGPLLSEDGEQWVGTAILGEFPDEQSARDAVDADAYGSVEVHHWQFGGRR